MLCYYHNVASGLHQYAGLSTHNIVMIHVDSANQEVCAQMLHLYYSALSWAVPKYLCHTHWAGVLANFAHSAYKHR